MSDKNLPDSKALEPKDSNSNRLDKTGSTDVPAALPKNAPETLDVASVIRDTEKTRIPKPELSKAEKRMVGDGVLTNLTLENVSRAHRIQDELLNFSSSYMDKNEDEQVKAIQEEQKAGTWGPASQAAYKQHQEWFYNKVVPALADNLRSLGQKLPVNWPEDLNKDSFGVPEDPEVYVSLSAAGKKNNNTIIDPASALGDKQYQKFLDNSAISLEAMKTINLEAVKIQNRELQEYIKEKNLPTGWLKGADEDPFKWRDAAAKMISFANLTKNALEAMDDISRASKKQDFPFVPPPGTKFTRDANGEIARNDDGTIQNFNLKLPDNLRLDDPANEKILQPLIDWHNYYGKQIIDATLAYREAQINPEQVLTFDTVEVPNMVAKVNAKGEFTGLAKANDSISSDEKSKPCNLICSKAEIRVAKEGINAGKKVIVHSVEAYQVPWYGAYNLIGTKVASFKPEEELLDEKKDYAVKNGDQIHLIRGKNLEEVLTLQRIALRAQQGSVMLMDGAMLVSAGGSGLAARSAIKAAQVATTEGLTVAARTATMAGLRKEFSKSLIRGGVAAAGIFNNAGAKDFSGFKALNAARTAYFMTDTALGVRSGVSSLLRHTPETPSALAIKNVLKNSPWLRNTTVGSGYVFKGLEGYYAHSVGKESLELGKRAQNLATGTESRDLLRDASYVVSDGLGVRIPNRQSLSLGDGLNYKPDKGSLDLNDPAVLKKERAVIDHYNELLTLRCSEDNQTRIKEMFEKTKKLLDPKADASEVKKFQQELMANFMLSKNDLNHIAHNEGVLETHGVQWPANDVLSAVKDPVKRLDLTHNSQQVIEQYEKKIGPDLRAAAAIAILTLCRKEDGSIPTELHKEDFEAFLTIPGPVDKRAGYRHSGASVKLGDLGPQYGWDLGGEWHKYNRSITSDEIAQQIIRDIDPKEAGGRAVAVGDLLTRIGAISGQQYALLIRDVLENPHATKQEKMSAMTDSMSPRLATIIDGLQQSEEIQGSGKEGVGASAAELTSMLKNTAQTAIDPDVRAMAAAIIYGTNHPNPEAGQKFLRENNLSWQKLANDTDGKYSQIFKNYVEKEAQREDNIAVKFNATVLLGYISNKDDQEAQKKIATNLANCIRLRETAISLKAIDELTPDRIKLLDQAQANEARKTALRLLTVPRANIGTSVITEEQERRAARMVNLIPKLNVLFKDADSQFNSNLCHKLEGLIDPRVKRSSADKPLLKANPNSLPEAKLFPQLQAAAITALADNGSINSIPLIRARLTGEMNSDGQLVKVDNTNAQVRFAAVNALAQLKDKQLGELLPVLIKSETNPAIAQRLNDLQIEFPSSLPETKKERERRIYNDAVWDMVQPKILNNKQAEEFFNLPAYSLLESKRFAEEVKTNTDAAMYSRFWFNYWTDFSGFEETHMRKASAEVNQKRWEQWKELCALARTQDMKKQEHSYGGNGEEAIAAVFHVLTQNGRPLATPAGQQPIELKGLSASHEEAKFWSKKAAEAFRDFAKNGVAKDKIAYCIAEGLKDPHVDPEAKIVLLDGLEHLADAGLSRTRLAKTIHHILETENSRPEQYPLLKSVLIKKFAHHMQRTDAIGVLKAISEHDGSPAIRELASQTLATLQK